MARTRRLSNAACLASLLLLGFALIVESIPNRATKDNDPNNSPLVATAAAAVVPKLRRTVVAGRLGPVINRLLHIPNKLRPIRSALANAFFIGDVVVLGLVSWLTEPVAEVYFAWQDKDGENYQDTWLSRAASLISQLAKVSGIVYLSDMLSVVLNASGFQLDARIQPMIAKAVYTLWVAWRLRNFKEFMLRRMIGHETDVLQEGKQNSHKKLAKVLGRVLDGVIAVWLILFLQDIFQISTGRGLTSVLTAGGTVGLIFSLASKDLAAGLINGLAIYSSHKFAKGDEIVLGDGAISGIVDKMGAFETLIKSKFRLRFNEKEYLGSTHNVFSASSRVYLGYDGIIVRIPNSQVAAQRVKNLSRTPTSQVKQTLWFSYDDIDSLPTVVEEIKKELIASCPKLITDGSRPFRVHWNEFKDDHLEILVNINFSISPASGLEVMDNRQLVMQAIGRAVKNSGVEFAIPNYLCKNEGVGQPQKTIIQDTQIRTAL